MPIAYVIREEEERLPSETTDNDIDLATRGRLDGEFWVADNRAVWEFLHDKCVSSTVWGTILPYQRSRDGRGAYLALKRQLMGVDVQRTMLVKAETTLAKIHFDGKSRSFTYIKYISNMRQAFLDLGPDDQYSETRRVNKLLSSFKVPALQHLGSTVRNDPYWSRNFEAAVAFIGGELEALQQKSTSDRHLSAVGRFNPKSKPPPKDSSKKPGKDHKKKGGPKPQPKYNAKDPGAYVDVKVWKAMTPEEQEAAREARKKQGIKARNASSLISTKTPVADTDDSSESSESEAASQGDSSDD